MKNIVEIEEKFNSFNKFNLVFASFFFSLMTLCVKNIDRRIPIYELVFFRSLLSLMITLFIINLKNINPSLKHYPNINNLSNSNEDNQKGNFYFLILKNIERVL